MIAWPRKLSGQAAAREAPPVQPEMPRSTWEQRGQYVFFRRGLGAPKAKWNVLANLEVTDESAVEGIKRHQTAQQQTKTLPLEHIWACCWISVPETKTHSKCVESS